MKDLLITACLSLLLGACATRHDLVQDYKESLGLHEKTSGRTTVVILIDGLGANFLEDELHARKLPHIQEFFHADGAQLQTAHTIFPSLTFPSITSLLTGMPVNETHVFGNIIWDGQKSISFESPFRYKKLRDLIKGKTILSRFARKKMRTVSLDYAFHDHATAYTESLDLEAGLSLTEDDFGYLDQKSIDSLNYLFESTPIAQWPDFVYLHLVGVDLVEHNSGPASPEAQRYLRSLDLSLAPTFQILSQSERERKTVVLLTADHGFDLPVTHVLPIDTTLSGMTILNEGRFIALYEKSSGPVEARANLARTWAERSHIDLVAVATEHGFEIYSRKGNATVTFRQDPSCRDQMVSADWNRATDKGVQPLSVQRVCLGAIPIVPEFYYPYFLRNVSAYFTNDHRPDMLILPEPGSSFLDTYRGQHGGPLPREIEVPVLLHGAELKAIDPANSDLLRFAFPE